jgi:hypothetical protein
MSNSPASFFDKFCGLEDGACSAESAALQHCEDSTGNVLLASIAISLKRIADALDDMQEESH